MGHRPQQSYGQNSPAKFIRPLLVCFSKQFGLGLDNKDLGNLPDQSAYRKII